MQKPAIHPLELERLSILKTLDILDTKPEERFDNITKLAIEKLHVPISTITLLDEKREWFKSSQGLNKHEDSREASFCGHALLASDIFIVEDTLKDERFVDNPHVKSHNPIRFYAGISLKHTKTGLPIGVFCIKDYKPRILTNEEIGVILELAKEAEYQLNIEKIKSGNK